MLRADCSQLFQSADLISTGNDGMALSDRHIPAAAALQVKEAHPWLTMLARHDGGERL
ncbi:hypothetical protein D3C87_1886420 [compost metagenome]